jgi:hypothetical protein
MKYTEEGITSIYDDNVRAAARALGTLPVLQNRDANITTFHGWLFEQTILTCLTDELQLLGLVPVVQEQAQLVGRARVDLLVGWVAIEIKLAGSFGADAAKYGDYRAYAQQRGWTYCYISQSESYSTYRNDTKAAFGPDCTFYLDEAGSWERFVRFVASKCGASIVQ